MTESFFGARMVASRVVREVLSDLEAVQVFLGKYPPPRVVLAHIWDIGGASTKWEYALLRQWGT